MNNLRIIKDNFIEVFSHKGYLIFSIITTLLIGLLFMHFTNSPMIKGNFGLVYYYTVIFAQILISLLFGIFLPVTVYKYVKFSSFNLKENTSSFIGTFLGVLVAGCPACSITVASYLGLAGIVSFLPWYGLELKIIAIPMLIYANYSGLKDLNVCKMKLRKKEVANT